MSALTWLVLDGVVWYSMVSRFCIYDAAGLIGMYRVISGIYLVEQITKLWYLM